MKHAFSLVELSIVLVILGLLTGGILGGQSLIRAAELRAFPTEVGRYVTATQTFRDKYFALPGDMNNAVAFWGAADSGDGTGNDCHIASSTTVATCNGDGNGSIAYSITTIGNESFRYWQHLANAGLIEGNYTGVAAGAASGSRTVALGVNTPRSKINNMGYTMYDWGTLSGTAYSWDGHYGHTLQFGTQEATPDIYEAVVFRPEEMWNIDTKMDDGRPGTGKLRTYFLGGTCTNVTTDPAVGEYLLNNPNVACWGTFSMGF